MIEIDKYKKWNILVGTFLIVIVLGNYLVWNYITYDLINNSGDLARTGYIFSAAVKKTKSLTLNKKHLEINDYFKTPTKIDALTIGDSFSKGAGQGTNSFYQDYIASYDNQTVLNIGSFSDKESIDTIITLLNSGFLDEIKPKTIIIESVERFCIQRFAREIDFDQRDTIKNIKNYYSPKKEESAITEPLNVEVPTFNFINSANYNVALNYFLYKLSDNAFHGQVYVEKLNKKLFTSKAPDELLFYHEDIENVGLTNDEKVELLNRNMNKLSSLLNQKGIQLVFMPVVDKYDLYSNYIINNHYAKSTFFEKLRKMQRDYFLIDTKEILSKEVGHGETDIFYADDTHWSWKASKAIFKDLHINSKHV